MMPKLAPASRKRLRWSALFAAYILLPVAAVLTLSHALSSDPSGPQLGGTADEIELPVVFGKTGRLRLAEHRGTAVVIEVFASWCDYCRTSTPVLASAARAPRTSEVRFFGVSVDDTVGEAAAAAYLWGIPYDVAWDDGSVLLSWNISALPTVVVIDQQGKVRHVGSGRPDAEQLEDWLSDVGAARVN